MLRTLVVRILRPQFPLSKALLRHLSPVRPEHLRPQESFSSLQRLQDATLSQGSTPIPFVPVYSGDDFNGNLTVNWGNSNHSHYSPFK